jgi:hypothetical protein
MEGEVCALSSTTGGFLFKKEKEKLYSLSFVRST